MSQPQPSAQQADAKEKQRINEALTGVLSELLFVILPLLVLALVLIHKGTIMWNLLSRPEISIASSILIGQTVVKFVSGVSVAGVRSWERVALSVSILIVLFLVPTLVIMSLIMTSEYPAIWLVWTQLVLFLLSVFLFIFLGATGSAFLKDAAVQR